ncbi:hypothetical protein LDG_7413 [Legionella drancourtii LLAP12]|uniref:Uncharacterized protein n=1 Tax=Legionella drancourtii LLAP12 TaxID=658187 RepID=G9EQ67_9GAMM|nr:hypothetical protein LDG_7413 [Legionella drancourtii LLAP12]
MRFPHVKVGHRQGFILIKKRLTAAFFVSEFSMPITNLWGLS